MMKEASLSELVWQGSQVTNAERYQMLKQQPVTLWLTGLSGAGKSTLAYSLERALTDLGRYCFVLDGDNVRHTLNRNLGFNHEDRTENVRRAAEVAKLMNDAGLIVIAAFISPYLEDREVAKAIIGESFFREVYVSTPLNICELRDPKGLYLKARSGELLDFTGVSSVYEQPESPALAIDTSKTNLDDAIKQLIDLAIL